MVMSSRPSVPVVLAGPDGPSHPVVHRRPGPVIPALAATITLAITAELGGGILADVTSTKISSILIWLLLLLVSPRGESLTGWLRIAWSGPVSR